MRSVALMQTTSRLRPDTHRYYVEGGRVSRARFEEIKTRACRLDSFITLELPEQVRQYCVATLNDEV